MKDGDVIIASITSCTNTSNPSVMWPPGDGQMAVERGWRPKPNVKTRWPREAGPSDLPEKAGLLYWRRWVHVVG
jgi:aconitate hydratase